jgi:hypothetical protein
MADTNSTQHTDTYNLFHRFPGTFTVLQLLLLLLVELMLHLLLLLL